MIMESVLGELWVEIRFAFLALGPAMLANPGS